MVIRIDRLTVTLVHFLALVAVYHPNREEGKKYPDEFMRAAKKKILIEKMAGSQGRMSSVDDTVYAPQVKIFSALR